MLQHQLKFAAFVIVEFESVGHPQCDKIDLKYHTVKSSNVQKMLEKQRRIFLKNSLMIRTNRDTKHTDHQMRMETCGPRVNICDVKDLHLDIKEHCFMLSTD